MKYLGEETTREVVKQTVRKVEYIRCDRCEKKIMPSKYREEKNNYVHVHTWHNDWGNDSIDSHERNSYCKDCAKQVVAEYISTSSGTEELELKNEYLFEDETYEDFDEWEFDARLACNNHPTEKGGD
jgi:hypothetical protein